MTARPPLDVEMMFASHHREVWRLIRRLSDPTTADDLAGEVFCVALDRAETFDAQQGTARNWLFGIALNLTRNETRRNGRHHALRPRLWEHEVSQDPAQLLVDRDSRHAEIDAVREAVAALPIAQREVVVLTAWQELTYAEAAEVLDVPIGTVRSRLNRARARLTEHLSTTTPTTEGNHR